MQPIRGRKDLLSPVMNECTEGNNTRQLLHKNSRGLKVKLKKCLLLFPQLKNTHNLDHYTFFSVFICQIPQEKIPMKQTTQNGKCLVQFSFTCLFVPENSLRPRPHVSGIFESATFSFWIRKYPRPHVM